MPNPYALLGGLLTVLALCAASFGFGHHVDHLAFVAYQKTETAAALQQEAANKTALLHQQEADQAAMAQINQTRSGELNEITQRRDALLAANRNLTQRLWVITSTASQQPTVVSSPRAGGPVDDGGSEAEIPKSVAPWLIDQFTQADSDATLVGALQKVIIEDRRICNGELPGVTSVSAK